jgi:alpha-D-xyloside xylohydrolase
MVRKDGQFVPLPLPSRWTCTEERCSGRIGENPITLTRTREPTPTGALLERIVLSFEPGDFWGVSFSILPGEVISGLGMTMVGLNLVGYRLPMHLELMLGAEGGINEVHLPLYTLVSSRSYGILRRSVAPGWVDMGKLQEGTGYILSLESTAPVEFLFGPPAEISAFFLRAQGGWTGIPIWALGLFFWRNENSHASEMIEDLYELKTRGYPLSVLWFDNPWETARNTFIPDPRRIPDLSALIATLREAGVRFLLWISPHVNLPPFEEPPYREEAGRISREVRNKNLIVRDRKGNPILSPWGSGFGYLLDFTRDEVKDWLWERLEPLLRAGVRGWKLDYGEDLIPWVLYPDISQNPSFNEGTPLEAPAVYKRAYHRVFRELTERVHGDDIFLLSRTGTFGEIALTHCLWPGDMNNDFSENELFRDPPGKKDGGLPAVILATLQLNVSGVPCLASDTGGYRGGTPEPEVFMRWAGFSAYQPVMQIGGGGDHRPWGEHFQGTPVEEVVRFFAREHALFAPYLLELVLSAQRGVALPVYPLLLEGKSGDPYLYRLGKDLLLRPVTEPGGRIITTLPPGRWIEFFTGTVVEGGKVLDLTLPLDRIGLWQRPGSVVLRFSEVPDPFPSDLSTFKKVPLLPYVVPVLTGSPETTIYSTIYGEIKIFSKEKETTIEFPELITQVSMTLAGLSCSAIVEGADRPIPPQGWTKIVLTSQTLRISCP